MRDLNPGLLDLEVLTSHEILPPGTLAPACHGPGGAGLQDPGLCSKFPLLACPKRAAPYGLAFLPGMWFQVRPVWAGQPSL